MQDEIHQAELIDAYVDDLLQSQRILPPGDLNLEMAEITRELVLNEQRGLATNLNYVTQRRVWEQVLVNTNLARSKQAAHHKTGLGRLRGTSLQLVSALLMFIAVLALVRPGGNVEIPKEDASFVATSISTTSVATSTTTSNSIRSATADEEVRHKQPIIAVAALPPFQSHNARFDLIMSREEQFNITTTDNTNDEETYQKSFMRHLYYR